MKRLEKRRTNKKIDNSRKEITTVYDFLTSNYYKNPKAKISREKIIKESMVSEIIVDEIINMLKNKDLIRIKNKTFSLDLNTILFIENLKCERKTILMNQIMTITTIALFSGTALSLLLDTPTMRMIIFLFYFAIILTVLNVTNRNN